MKVIKLHICLLAGLLISASGLANENSPYGNWSLALPFDDMSAGALILSKDAKGRDCANILLRWSSPTDTRNCKIEGNTFTVYRKKDKITGVVKGDIAECTITGFGKKNAKFIAKRNKPITPANPKDAVYGETIDLLADGLKGWEAKEKKAKNFGWSFKDGVLSKRINRKAAKHSEANLITKRADFFDFAMSYDVRVPKGCNSGVYLRGRYEIQVVDSYGKKTHFCNMAALYGRIKPSVAAEKAPGEWQHVDVILYKRHLTVDLNGVRIIDNVPVLGVTGGAIDADQTVPGPIYLQGDHTDADFKNMIIKKIIK